MSQRPSPGQFLDASIESLFEELDEDIEIEEDEKKRQIVGEVLGDEESVEVVCTLLEQISETESLTRVAATNPIVDMEEKLLRLYRSAKHMCSSLEVAYADYLPLVVNHDVSGQLEVREIGKNVEPRASAVPSIPSPPHRPRRSARMDVNGEEEVSSESQFTHDLINRPNLKNRVYREARTSRTRSLSGHPDDVGYRDNDDDLENKQLNSNTRCSSDSTKAYQYSTYF